MLRVLFFELSDAFGGIESFLMNILENVDLKNNKDLQFDFVTSVDNPAGAESFKAAGVNIIRVSEKKEVFNYRRDIDNLMKSGKYGIVHIQKNSLSNAIPVQMAIKHGIPYVLHIQNSAPSKNGMTLKMLHYINRSFYSRKATVKLACGEHAAKWMFKSLAGVKIIKNGINPDDFKRDDEKRNIIRSQYSAKNSLVLCNVGRFTDQKNHKYIIEVFNELHKVNTNSKLFLVGDGVNFEMIKRKVKELELSDFVVFFGSLKRDKEREVLMASDVFIMPSLYEGVSIASIEAQMAGLSLLVSDTVDKDTNITGNVSFMSLKKTPKEWAKIILDIIYNKNKSYDANKIEHDIRNAGYDMKYTTEWLLNIYEKKARK